MREHNWRQQRSPSPKPTPSMLPPLSKFYHGPAQGWGSNESSPSHNGSTGSLNPSYDMSPALAPRQSASPTTHRSPQPSQGWHSPALSASTASQPTHTPYMSNSWALKSGVSDASVNPTWDSAPPDASTWSVSNRQKHSRVSECISKPPLPPRSSQEQNQLGSREPRLPSRFSATTIDVPLFLQPVAYDPVSAPPMPEYPPLVPPSDRDQDYSPSEPQRLPPPPSRKIPLDTEDEPIVATMIPKRPEYDPQHNYGGDQQQSEHRSRRPHVNPQYSHDNLKDSSWQQQPQQRPMIPAPQFTLFDVESALPPVRSYQEPPISPQLQQSQPTHPQQKSNVDRYSASQNMNESSVSSFGYSEQVHWTQAAKPWDSQAAYAPSPERQHGVLLHQDGHSISATDLSSNTAGKSTPESQQTSNSSCRQSGDQKEHSRHDQEGDDSFYWHSGRSSSGAEDEDSRSSSPAATPGQSSVDQRSSTTNSTVVLRQHLDLPVQSTSFSLSNPASYGASALGFGGPSDWEYFGDYEAEEIDDEELYSRPKPRDSVSAVEGSAELPADPSFAGSMQRSSQSELHTASPMTSKTPCLPEESLARQQAASNSRKHILGTAKSSIGGDYAVRPNPAPEQSPTSPRPLSGDHVAPSSISPEQRPDLYEVIRAWSEAPVVGKMRDNATSFQGTENKKDEPADVAEASLASTPGERMFGVDVILKNAPSLPKVPSSNDQAKRLGDQTQQSSNTRTALLDDQSIPQNVVEQELKAFLSEQPEPVSKNSSRKLDLVLVDDQPSSLDHASNDPLTRDAEPSSSDSLVASHLRYTIPAESVIASDLSPRHPVSVELSGGSTEDTDLAQHKTLQLRMPYTVQPEPPQEAGQEVTHDVARQSPDETITGRPRTTLQPFVQNIVEKLSSSRLDDDPRAGQLADPPTRKPIQLWHESTQNVRSGSLQEITPSGLLESLQDLVQGMSMENSEKLDHAAPSQSRSLEKLKTSVDCLPTTAEFDKANVIIEQSLGKGGALEQRQQLGAPVAPIVEPSQSFEISRRSDKANDPYAGLDPWGKASLNRFAAMLREEARAESNNDRLNIFSVFTSRESRLRVVLYGTEEELITPQKQVELQTELPSKREATKENGMDEKPAEKKLPDESGFVKQAVQRANTMDLHHSLKALPALPSNRDSVIGLTGNALAPLVIHRSSNSSVDCESLTMESPMDRPQYSPGGRSIVTRLPGESGKGGLNVSRNIVASVEAVAGANANHPPSFDVPGVLGVEDAELKKPAYTPLKYSEPRSEVKTYLANRKSVIRPYAFLTQGSLENGSTFGKRMDIDTTPTTNTSSTAPTSQYNPSSPPKGDDASDVTMEARSLATESQHDLRRFTKADFDPLLTVLPESGALAFESTRLRDLRDVMGAVPDDFRFIHQSVVAWDVKAKKQREGNERKRHARQMESEQRIDSLFDDHEIGYGDISELESEFKRSEAAIKADEDRSEYQLFVSDVFNLVWTRLHYELDQIFPHYEQYSTFMKDTLAGKDMFDGSSDSLALAPTMSALLGLHQKLEIRHQKAFEAVLERDRRLKKTQISPWYTLSNISKVKQLEKQFEDAEKKAIIEYCEQRDTRVNRLMDVLDENTLRGVGANQDYMEAIMKAVRRIASGRAFASVAGSNEPTAGMEEVEKAKAIAALLATSSEQIVQTFHVADMLLNAADYEVSIAKAKVAKADTATLTKLKEERSKEDQKLMRDLEHRLVLIREDTRRTNDEIVKLMLFLGTQNGHGDGGVAVQPWLGSGAANPGHEARLQKALEEAKSSNGRTESGG